MGQGGGDGSVLRAYKNNIKKLSNDTYNKSIMAHRDE